MKSFYQVLVNTLISSVVTNFLWFAITFWVYLETRSVLATSIIGGSYMLLMAFSGMVFGTFVDNHKKKIAMLISSVVTLCAFVLATVVYLAVPQEELLTLTSPFFVIFVLLVLTGGVVANMRMIALSTVVTLLVPEKQRDKANGMVGTINGIAFTITSIFSGLAVGMLGMHWVLGISVVLMFLVLLHLYTVTIPEKEIVHLEGQPKQIDIAGAIAAIQVVPGLLALIFFATFNNFLGGVFMSLMDPYGLSLVSVELWGVILSLTSLGFIAGGLYVSKKGLGKSPLKTLFLANIIMWTTCIFFTVQASIFLVAGGIFIYMCLIPAVEAAEQTIIQTVVPLSKQGRVFGFAQSIESAASPITAFAIGPIAEFFVIRFMTTGSGAATIGSWFGTGADRGMALIFMTAGVIGLIVTISAMTSRSYKLLYKHYSGTKVTPDSIPATPLV